MLITLITEAHQYILVLSTVSLPSCSQQAYDEEFNAGRVTQGGSIIVPPSQSQQLVQGGPAEATGILP